MNLLPSVRVSRKFVSRFAGLTLAVLLSSCVGPEPLENVYDLPLPPDITGMRDYDAAHSTTYETSLKQMILIMVSVLNTAKGSAPSAEFFVIPDGRGREGEMWEFYKQELTPSGWQRDEDSSEVAMGLIDHFRRRSSKGEQRFVVTYLSVPDTRDLLMVRLLYPVW